eukprot:CAMPEP_0181357082 /NCGR_PEP_ID=MMETSP1106-20121128/4765_1 /TAXON_ID=81844 /ORGANISM="Mantoniella antarctica, Strain SL-175" /LENGTH=134 /DNA_ID=CAMNT_0023469909 /DNA_START=371 /DNA_END=775 /DNA_ORIENTATION=-
MGRRERGGCARPTGPSAAEIIGRTFHRCRDGESPRRKVRNGRQIPAEAKGLALRQSHDGGGVRVHLRGGPSARAAAARGTAREEADESSACASAMAVRAIVQCDSDSSSYDPSHQPGQEAQCFGGTNRSGVQES